MSIMTHQDWTDELVAQIEARTDAKEPVTVEFYLDDDKITELVLSDVKFEDGVIQCKLGVF